MKHKFFFNFCTVIFTFFQAEHHLLHDPTAASNLLAKDDDDELLLLAESGQATPALGGRLG